MKNKRTIMFLTVIIIVVLIILIMILSSISKNYKINYKVDGYDIIEEYNKDLKVYYFSLKRNDITYNMVMQSKYKRKKELIKKVNTYQNENDFCVSFFSKHIDTYPVCSSDGMLVDYMLLSETNDEFYKRNKRESKSAKFENVRMDYLNSRNYLVWAHDGYYYVDGKNNKKIDLLKEETYYNSLALQVDEFVLTPNYNQDHTFDEIFVINLKNGKMETWKLDSEISFNSYFLGTLDGKVYIIDRKNEIQYSLNPKKQVQEIVSNKGYGLIWDSEWKKVSMVKLINNDYSFETTEIYDYRLNGDALMLDYYNRKGSMLVSFKKANKIVKIINDEVYYLVGDKLYTYSPFLGEIRLITYSEWEFNNMNSIFIY